MATMTSQQLRYYEARMHGKCRSPVCGVPIEPIEDESDLHNAIIDYCRERGWQYLHGSMAERTHRTLGEPDFIILAHGSQLRMVECKSKTGKLSLDQQGFIAHAKKNGHVVYMVRSMDEFVRLFA
jgi:hypothetical protein